MYCEVNCLFQFQIFDKNVTSAEENDAFFESSRLRMMREAKEDVNIRDYIIEIAREADKYGVFDD
jgi:hypothetical protein